MDARIVLTADGGTAYCARELHITKSDLMAFLRESEVERDPKHSWKQACRRHCREHGYSFSSLEAHKRLQDIEDFEHYHTGESIYDI